MPFAVAARKEKSVQKRKILHEKKAFNTSIILASVSIPEVKTVEERDAYIEQALLRVDVSSDEEQGIITTHLIEHLLQYAPDKEEVRFQLVMLVGSCYG